jgi:murein DD-endopeptidase MepM/ murein hydrolase activator NlpD
VKINIFKKLSAMRQQFIKCWQKIPRQRKIAGVYLLTVAVVFMLFFWRTITHFQETVELPEDKTSNASEEECQFIGSEASDDYPPEHADIQDFRFSENTAESEIKNREQQEQHTVKEKNASAQFMQTVATERQITAMWPLSNEGEVIRRHNELIRETLRQGELFRYHRGIDIRTAAGSEIFAPWEGSVKKVIDDDRFHNHALYIEHQTGQVLFMSNLEELLVQEGEQVRKGQVLAVLGHCRPCAENGEAPYLHLEVLVEGESVDPLPYFN